VAIVADQAIQALSQRLANHLKERGLLLGPVIAVPGGEASKSFAGFERVCNGLLDLGIERNHAVVVIGGGVVGDLAGFAAASVKRGVALIQVPTTLLAQVDSSVGGKTGINSRHGKNLVGAFHQPSLVLIDTDTLDTLPPRQFRAGYAEVAKYGLLGDADFFAWLEDRQEAVYRREPDALIRAIEISCRMKAAIVERDERESGDRALLNLGHTFGHAIEAWAGYSGAVLHGEAIALGMVLAAEFSEMQGICAGGTAKRIAAHFEAAGLPRSFDDIAMLAGGKLPGADQLLGFMAQDKKVSDGKMNLVLLRRVGDAFVARDVPADKLRAFLGGKLG
jgi:3-dehydroquinate synthase